MQFLEGDATLAAPYAEYQARYDSVCKMVAEHKDKAARGGDSGSDGSDGNDSDDNGKGKGKGKGKDKDKGDEATPKVLCAKCKPHEESRCVSIIVVVGLRSTAAKLVVCRVRLWFLGSKRFLLLRHAG